MTKIFLITVFSAIMTMKEPIVRFLS